jgi:signal peptidase II
VNKSVNPRTLALSVAAAALFLDQLSKWWVLGALQRAGSTLILPGPVDLTLVFNRSNAFGLVPVTGEITRWGLAAVSLVVAALLAFGVVRRSTSQLNAIGIGFIIAGAIGNALDRVRFGAVIDFFNASKLGFVWVFNIADLSIDAGIALLLLATFFTQSASTKLGDAPDARTE